MQRLYLFAVGLAACLFAYGCAGRGSQTGVGGVGSGSGSGSSSGSAGAGAGSTGVGSGSGTGTAGVSGGSPDGGADPDAGPTVTPLPNALSAANACTTGVPGPRKLWRLSAPEFAASIHSVFNDTAGSAPVTTVFSDPVTLGFSVDANSLLVQGLNASQLEDNAEAIASWAAANSKLSIFASCTVQTTACATTFIQGLGRRLFRTTLAAKDPRIATYSAIFMAGSSFSDGAQAVISAMLQSPYFLYRSELGVQNGNTFTLTPYEVASELAYLLTGNTPDDTLLTAADSVAAGSLAMSSMIDQQAQRLLTAGSTTAVMGFMNGWLGLPRLYTTAKDNTVYMLTQTLQDDMATESQDLIMEAFNGGGSFGSVLTADHSFLNKDLATFYGITATSLSTTTFASVPYAGTSRDPGLLATGTILNGYARPDTDSPTQRGHLVRTRMLCQDIPPPPPGVNTTFTAPTMPETTRQQFENNHSGPANATCYQCHQLMDWIGFAFESYDGFGRHRTTDNGLPVDDTAIVYNDPEGANDNVTGLSGPGSLPAYLAASDDMQRCMMRYWTYYAYGSSSWGQDGCTYDAIYQEASSSSFGLKSVLMAIIHAPNFTTRVQDQ
jgi:hypothetical protein